MKRLTLLLGALITPLLLTAGTIYLSPTGDDRAEGSKSNPLRTPHAALKMAREWRRTNDPRTRGGIQICFEAGRYHLDRPIYIRPEDSGTADSPTTLQPAEGAAGKVFIVGSKPLTSWVKQGSEWITEAPRIHGRPL